MLSDGAGWSSTSRHLAAISFLILTLAPAAASAQRVAIDKAHSTVTVHVYKSGLFSGLAHNHVIQAPIASGSIDANARAVELSFNVADMKVVDPDASDSERQKIEATMKDAEVLDPAKFPVINFVSTGVSSSSPGHTQVTGTLKLHGTSRQVSLPVALQDGRYSGSITLKQTDYGITPVKIAGGAVRVKDEIVIEFQVASE